MNYEAEYLAEQVNDACPNPYGIRAKLYYDINPMRPDEWGTMGYLLEDDHLESPDDMAQKAYDAIYYDVAHGTKDYETWCDMDTSWDALTSEQQAGVLMFHGLRGVLKVRDMNNGGYLWIAIPDNEDYEGLFLVEEYGAYDNGDVAKVIRETWKQYFKGEVYGYQIEDAQGNHIDSCCSFYGEKHAIESTTEALRYEIEERDKQQQALADAIVLAGKGFAQSIFA